MYIDIVNPYIKSLGFTDIMSDSKEKTPTVSPDQGADGETATLVQLAEVGETPKNFKTTDRDGKLKLTLRVGHKVTLPTETIDKYDAWYESMESCDYGKNSNF